jgi:hypothetical protein
VPSFFGNWARRAFRARSGERDAQTDQARVDSIVSAIEAALAAAEAERDGLSQRVDECLARASVTFGNDIDEYLTREPAHNEHQRLFEKEISNGRRRIEELSISIEHFKSLKAAMLSQLSYLGQARPENHAMREDAVTPP